MPAPMISHFGGGQAEGSAADSALLGGKGANLAEMTRMGVPVPPGFTITTEVCRYFLRAGTWPDGLEAKIEESVRRLERDASKTFGGDENPLLVSVRSGAAASMPGMMETILNLGLNDRTAAALARAAENERFAFDSYRRFVQMYGEVVLGVAKERFDALLDARKRERGVEADTGLNANDLRELVAAFKAIVAEETGAPFPDEPVAQLRGAIDAVFRSWNTPRAIDYRRLNRIPHDLGTAVSVVSMVYGNMGDDSGTGVAFTRDPSTGERRFFGEFLLNAQGEDVVAGTRTPISIHEMTHVLPEAYEELMRVQAVLEHHYRDMQDMEFTVERGRLYMLQTRAGKRTAAAAIRIACEMIDEGMITEDEAVLRVQPAQLDQLLHPRLDPKAKVDLLTTGLPASPGAASGIVVFDPDDAAARAEDGEHVILIRNETSPDDFHGMVAARAIVTGRGGMTSHAAVVARGMGKCCVVGATELMIDADAKYFSAHGREVREGEWVTVDGTTGRVIYGQVPTVASELSDHFRRLMALADARRRLRVRTNADTPADARKAREFGAEGIGLCRTEHMFFEGNRIYAVREMILARSSDERRRALEKLLPMQREDFKGIFRAMDGLPVTIRFLDPPLHEFLPRSDQEVRATAKALGIARAVISRQTARHHESNPMLGNRGVRLGICYPEISEMQARAAFEAAVEVAREGVDVRPEIMIPLVGNVKEFAVQHALVKRIAEEVLADAGVAVPYMIGTMIELPRAALTAPQIASLAEFFSFGTNDLTQTTYGISRDDAASFLPQYIDQGIFTSDPFEVLDREGVGRLIEIATREGRAQRPSLKVGVCGEHGGEPQSVAFFHATGLDYVSCSPFRVPVARLAAAHAALREAQAELPLQVARPSEAPVESVEEPVLKA